MDTYGARKDHPKSVEIVGNNEHLTALILFHLPTKYLFRFISVSKKWRSIITNPHFMYNHAIVHHPSLSGFFFTPKQLNLNQAPQIEFAPIVSKQQERRSSELAPAATTFLNSHGFRILQSCNGLLLCISSLTRNHYICNPTTSQFKLLPSCTESLANHLNLISNHHRHTKSSSTRYNSSLNLAFDPTVSPHGYKLISVINLDDDDHNEVIHRQIAIYSSKSGLWTLSGEQFSIPNTSIDFNQGVYYKGAIHWIIRSTVLTSSGIGGLYFNVNENHNLKPMPNPPSYSCEYFGESKGHLYYAVMSSKSTQYELYEIRDDYLGWDFKFKVDLNVIAISFPSMKNRDYDAWFACFLVYECDVLHVVKRESGDEDDVEIVLSIPGEVIVYDCKERRVESLCKLGMDRECGGVSIWKDIYRAHEYLETLFPL